MKYYFVFLCSVCFLFADNIIDFNKHNKVYNPYEPKQNIEQSSKSSVDSIQKQQSYKIENKNINNIKGDEFFNHYIKGRPKGIVRDFYIWQYFNENTLNAQQINDAYKLLNAKNPYIRKTLDRLGKTEKMPRDVECGNMNIKVALTQDNACLAISVRGRLSAFKTLPKKDTEAVISRLEKTNKDTVQAIKILSSSNRTKEIFNANSIVFAMVYHALSLNEKNNIHSTNPSKDLARLSEYETQGFYNILNSIVLDSGLVNLKNMLLKGDIKQAPHNTLFLLGINELRFGSQQKALEYFKRARGKATHAFFVDRATFWQYLVSKDKKYLEELLKSKNVNVFSIFASQKLNKTPSYRVISNLPSISSNKPSFDISDPYVWQDISDSLLKTNNISKLTKVIPYFSYKDTMPQLAYLMQKVDGYSTNYYIMPYEGLVKWNSREEQSLVFAIARQESYFIPTLISRSFALGIMQIMPANVKPFAKEMGRNDIEYNDLFKPKVSLEMGRHFIKQLQKEYKHPMLVAYAYNGGPGFLRRLLKKNELFLKNRDYEPWLSMELIPLEETRLYGMKVLANFIIYEKLLGKDINLENLLKETLKYENHKVSK